MWIRLRAEVGFPQQFWHEIMATRKRARSGITAPRLAEILEPFVELSGKNWIQYAETKIGESKVDKVAILKYAHIAAAIRYEEPTLTMKQSTVHAAMKELMAKFQGRWKFTDEQNDEWCNAMSSRLRNMLAAIAASERKKTPPKWLGELPWRTAADGNATDGAEKEGAKSEEESGMDDTLVEETFPNYYDEKQEDAESRYFFGWNAELRLAFRKPMDGTDDEEFSNPVVADASTGAIIARWDDGVQWEVAGVTSDGLSQRRRERRKPAWEGVHVATSHRLHIEQRPDRNLLLSMFEQNRQIAQVRMDLFGPLPEPQPAIIHRDHETFKAALRFLTPLAERYASGDLATTNDLRRARDEMLKTMRAEHKCTKKQRRQSGGEKQHEQRAKASSSVFLPPPPPPIGCSPTRKGAGQDVHT